MQDTNSRECEKSEDYCSENLPYKVREAFDKFCALYREAKDAGYSVILRDTSAKNGYYAIYLATETPKNLELTVSKTIRF